MPESLTRLSTPVRLPFDKKAAMRPAAVIGWGLLDCKQRGKGFKFYFYYGRMYLSIVNIIGGEYVEYCVHSYRIRILKLRCYTRDDQESKTVYRGEKDWKYWNVKND